MDHPRLLRLIEDPVAVGHLRAYFEPPVPIEAPTFPGSRFEFLAGGGDRPESADRFTADDLVAVSLLPLVVPGDVAVWLLEGDLGRNVGHLLRDVPTDVGIGGALGDRPITSSLGLAWDLLEEPHGMTGDIASALLARKRPRLVPLSDPVLRCAYGYPDVWNWLRALFSEDAESLDDRLVAVRRTAGVPSVVSPLRVLHVIVWMRHGPAHLRNECPGLR